MQSIARTAAKLEELSKLVKGGKYDPAKDHQLFGDWTDELVQKVSAKSANARSIEEAVSEAVRMAQMDPEAKIGKLISSGRPQAVAAIGDVVRWAEDARGVTLGPTQFVASRILDRSVVPDVSHVETEKDAPEPVDAGKLTEEELSYFENPPQFTSMNQYDEEWEERTPKKDSLPKTYPPLTWEDIGKNADLNKVMRAVKFFLGARDIQERNRLRSKRVKEPPVKKYVRDTAAEQNGDEGPDDSRVKNLVLRLLGHVRDEKLKGWRETNEKLSSGQRLTPEEQKLAKFWGSSPREDSIEAKTLGRTKQQLEHAVNEVFTRVKREPSQLIGDHKIVGYNAGLLRDSISSLKSYLDSMSKTRTRGDEEVPEATALRMDLQKLKEFLDKGGYKSDNEGYKQMLGRVKAAFKDVDPTSEQKESLSWMFPQPGSDTVSMKHPNEWVKALSERHNESQKAAATIERQLAGSKEDINKHREDLETYRRESAQANSLFQKARAMSEPLADEARRAFMAPALVRGAPLSAKDYTAESDRIESSLIAKHSPKYGEEAVRKVLDAARHGSEALLKANAARARLNKSRVGGLLLDLDEEKRKEDQYKGALEGALSLVEKDPEGDTYKFKDERMQVAHKAAEDLMEWVRASTDEKMKEINFDEISKLVARLDDVRKKLIKLYRTDTAGTVWDSGAGWMYKEPGETPASKGVAEGGFGGVLSEDPTAWMSDIKKNDALAFLLKKSEALSSGKSGRPEKVEGPSFSQVPELAKHIGDLIRSLKRYDPNTMRNKMIQTAMSRLDMGSAIRSSEERKKGRQEAKARKKEYESEGVSRIEPIKSEPAPEAMPKTASLPDLLRKFMTRMAALRSGASLFLERAAGKTKSVERPPFITKREKKSGPVYLQAFFINPDGVDEFKQALERGGFDFVNSMALESDIATPEEKVRMRKDLSHDVPTETGQPGRGFKFDIDDVVARTMMKGSASLREHVLNNKDKMAALLGKRKGDVEARAKSAQERVNFYRSQLNSPELKAQHEFLTELASFLRNPREAIEERVPEAFGAKVVKERRRTLGSLQERVTKVIEKVKRRDEFDRRRKEIERKAELDGVDPKTVPGYEYANKSVREVDSLLKRVNMQDLTQLREDIPNYDSLHRQLEKAQDKASSRSDVSEEDLRELRSLEDRVALMDAYLSKKPEFKMMQRTYPAEAKRNVDPETMRIYEEEVKGISEEKRKEIREEHEKRMKELSDLQSWDDFSNWIKKVQRPKPERIESVAVEAARAKALLGSLKKKLTEAESKAGEAPSEGESKAIEAIRARVVEAEKDVRAADAKLAKMKSRKTELGDIRPKKHEPKAMSRAWKDLMTDVEAVILGKKKAYPKMLVDLANESMLEQADPDEFTARIKAIEKKLHDAAAGDYPVLKSLFGMEGGWEKTKSDLESRLNEIKAQAAAKKTLLEAARKKFADLSPVQSKDAAKIDIEETQTPVHLAEADVAALEKDIADLERNAETLRGLLDEIGRFYSKQVQMSKKRLPEVKDKVEEIVSKPIPKPSIDDTDASKRVQILLDKAVATPLPQMEGIMRDIANIDSGIDSENERLRKEREALAKAKRDVDILYEDSPEKTDLLRKIEEKHKAINDMAPKSSSLSDFIDKVVEAKKSRGELTGTEQVREAKKVLKKMAVPSAKYVPGDMSDEERKQKEDDAEESRRHPVPKTIRFIDLLKRYPLPLGGLNKARAEFSNRARMFEKESKAIADEEGMEKIVKELTKHATSLEGLLKQQPHYDGIDVPDNLLDRYKAYMREMYTTFVEAAKTLSGMAQQAAEAEQKLRRNPAADKDALSKESARVAELAEYAEDVSRRYSRHLDSIETGWRQKSERPKVQKTEESDEFWSTRTRYEDMPKAMRGEPARTKRKTDYPLQRDVEPGWGIRKTAASGEGGGDDSGNIENWLRSAPRQYLEELPRIGVNDWDLIESLYGKRLGEYKDLLHGNQIVVDGPKAKARVKSIMEEANRRAAELARLEALKGMKVSITGRDIKVAEAGDIFNRELSSYLSKKNRASIGLEQAMREHDRLTQELDAYKEFVGEKDEPSEEDVKYHKTHEMKQELTDREVQSIIDQFYRGLFWYLQDYWATKPGKEAVFGTRESPEFSRLYDAMSALAGVRSNPTIQKVVRAGNEARRHLRDVRKSIAKIVSGMKRVGVDPVEVVERVKESYGSPEKRITSLKELAQEEERMKREAPFEGRSKSGVQLYFLLKYRDLLEDQIETKNAMYGLLREVVPAEYKVNVLEGIRDKTQDQSLKAEIDKRIKAMRDDIDALAERKARTAEEDITKALSEGLKTIDEIDILKDTMKKDQAEDVGKTEPETEERQANYRDHRYFDPNIFYGDIMQAKIAEIAARIIRKENDV